MGLFGAAHGYGCKKAPSLIFVAYPTMIKLIVSYSYSYILPERDPKNLNYVTHP